MAPDLAPTKTPETGPRLRGWVQFGDACLVLIDRLLSRQLRDLALDLLVKLLQDHRLHDPVAVDLEMSAEEPQQQCGTVWV